MAMLVCRDVFVVRKEQRRERVSLYQMEKALEIRETEAAEEREIYRQKVSSCDR